MRTAFFWFLGCAFAIAAPALVSRWAAPNSAPLASSVVLVDMPNGHGSGVYLGHGYVLTAGHVAEEGKGITVKTNEGNFSAELLWNNKAYDVAMLRIDPVAKISASHLSCDKLVVGQQITSSGNPLWLKDITTWGRVAGEAREIGPWASAVPTDIVIVPGMSGGPIFDRRHSVAGINVGMILQPMGWGGVSITGLTVIVPSKVVCMLLGKHSI